MQDIWQFIDDKLADEGQTMKVETLYKNFMGIGGPKDYGLTRRMVQIFLLCLVQEGKVRVALGPRSGLPYAVPRLRQSGEIDFSVKVLDALGEVQKMAKPENWEVLRPYAEKLLGETMAGPDCDDAAITVYRKRLCDLFAAERDAAPRGGRRWRQASSRRSRRRIPTPRSWPQVATLFATDIAGGDDIYLALHALKVAFGYRAFEDERAEQAEIDDLAMRLRNYRRSATVRGL